VNKHVVFILIVTFFMFCGCTKKEIYRYEGEPLEIAVAGDKKLPRFQNIVYDYVALADLDQSDTRYDGLIITRSAFPEADQDKYVPFFQSVKYPVFFYGADDFKYFAFTVEGMTIDMAKYENSPYVQGFKNLDDGTKIGWGFELPNDEKEKVDDKEMLLRIFNAINSNND